MASFKDKISLLIEKQAPEFVLSDHPKFLEFVKTYYTFMESAELTVTSIESTDGIRLETETAQENNLVLDASRLDTDRTQLDAGDKIILEEGYGCNVELIPGATMTTGGKISGVVELVIDDAYGPQGGYDFDPFPDFSALTPSDGGEPTNVQNIYDRTVVSKSRSVNYDFFDGFFFFSSIILSITFHAM